MEAICAGEVPVTDEGGEASESEDVTEEEVGETVGDVDGEGCEAD